VIYIASGTVAAVASGFTGSLEIAVAFRGILCAAASYLFMSVISAYNGTENSSPKDTADGSEILLRKHFTSDQKAEIGAVFVLVITALSGMNIIGINAGRILAAFVILAASEAFGVRGGSITYALSVFAVAIFSPDLARGIVVIAVSAVICGGFKIYGKLAVAAAFIIISTLTAVVIGVPSGSLNIFAEILIASFLFTLLPSKIYTPFVVRFRPEKYAVENFGTEHMEIFARNFCEMTENLRHAASILNNPEITGKNNSVDFHAAFGKICTNCADKNVCSMQKHIRFMHECEILESELTNNGYITAQNIHVDICDKKNLIANNINSAYNLCKFIENRATASSAIENIAISEMKCADQLFSSALVGIIAEPDSQTAHLLSAKLSEMDIKSAVTCGTDSQGYYHAEIFIYGESKVNTVDKIAKILERATGKMFESPLVTSLKGEKKSISDKRYRICFSEIYNLCLDTGVFESPAPEKISEGYSGDNHTMFEDGLGNVYYIISDGMGSGARAAVESSMTVSLLSELIKSGGDPKASIKFVKLSLQIKSSDETTATIDLLSVNRYSGAAVIYKMGAAKTMAALSGSVREYAGMSLPAGILTDNSFDAFSFNVKSGDKLAIFTDGIPESSYSKIREMLLSDGISSERAAKLIGEEKYDTDFEREDDKTLIFITVK
jgi:stage II sporulation protein E